jgi:hypothetical protein
MPVVIPSSNSVPSNIGSSTVLQLVQQASAEMGLTVPTQVVGNTATDVVQLLALINAVGYELTRMFVWQKMQKEYRFYTEFVDTTADTVDGTFSLTNVADTTGVDDTYMVLGENIVQDTYVASVDSATQVTINTQATGTSTGGSVQFCKTKYEFPSDYDRPVNRTHWDKGNHWEMIGPISPQEWQFFKSGYVQTTPRVRYLSMGGYFQIWPPLASQSYLGFEYISNAWVYDTSGNGKTSFTADTDVCIFPDRLMVLGLKLKYFEIKGFDTTAFMRDYQSQLSTAMATDAGAPTLSLAPRTAQLLIGYDSIPDSGYGR